MPFFHQDRKSLPVTQTELRVVFSTAPRLGFHLERSRRREPNQLEVKLDPSTGVRVRVDAKHAAVMTPASIELDMEFARGRGPSWGPAAAEDVVAGYAPWHEPWRA